MVKIYGHSDDSVCLDNSRYFEDEIECFDVAGVRLFWMTARFFLFATPPVSGAFSSNRKAPRRTSTRAVRKRVRTTTATNSIQRLMLFGMKLHRREIESITHD